MTAEMYLLFLATATVLIVSCICSLLEAALYALPASQIEMLAEQGRTSGKILKKLHADIQRPISAILSLNTLANTGGAVIAGAAFVSAYNADTEKEVYFTICLALSVLVFSEIIPKTAGVLYARSLASFIARPIQWLVWFFLPFIWLNQIITGLIMRNARSQQDISAEEIRTIARMSLQAGAISADQEKVISNILNLQNMRARDIMTPRTVVFSCDRHATLAEVRPEVGHWSHARVPIYDGDRDEIASLVLRREVLGALADGKDEVQLAALERPLHPVTEFARVNTLLEDFLRLRQHLFKVIDEYGVFSGIVTLEDVLEAIVGEQIVDETDRTADMQEQARSRGRRIFEDG